MNDDSSKQKQTQNEQKQNPQQQQEQQFYGIADMSKQTQNSTSQDVGAAGISESNFFAHYSPATGAYDEVLGEAGDVREHWRVLGSGLSQMGEAGINHRRKQIRRMVHQNGIAFSAYGDPAVRESHLPLDSIPHLIPADQWEKIEVGLRQKAELLNRLLVDIYGARTLLTRGVLPPEILFDHPHYQLPYHDLPAPNGRHLHFYSAEMIRSSDGKWWILSDRTDSPTGIGFALENRVVVSRAFPNEFRKNNVHRLAPYFIALREHLTSLSPKENPHIAILTAGANTSNYFEDSYLAKYLGFTLVESNDLVVRSGNVMLKTLAGLTQIDVIVRRTHGNYLDPLELGGGSPGIAGILQSIRGRNIAVVNSPGSGLVESPVFMAFMPRICRALLDSDLLLPGVATWWAGEKDSKELILDRIDSVNLLPAFRQRTIRGISKGKAQDPENPKFLDPQTMSREERIELVSRNPNDWVGQERIDKSSIAYFDDEALKPGYLSLRTFLTASGDSWHVLPGGLTRVTDSKDQPIRNPLDGSGAKDTWVLANKPVEQTSLLTSSGDILQPSRSNGFLPSRVADNLCWLGRYLERADSAARLLRSVVIRLTNETDPAESVELPVLIRALALEGHIDVGYAIEEFSTKLPSLENVLSKNTLDRADVNSLRSQVDQVILLASRVRERLSVDAWRIVQEMNAKFTGENDENWDLVDLLEIAEELIVNLAAFNGLLNVSMTRTHAFRFLNIGRRLELGLQITGLLKHCFVSPKFLPRELLESVLEIADSGMTYRSRYYANLQLPAVLDLLLIDEMNPRSLAFQMVQLNGNLEFLPGNSGQSSYSEDRRLAMDALHSIRMANLDELCKTNDEGERTELLLLLGKLEKCLPAISTSVSNRFLVHSGPIQQMISDGFGMT